MGHGLEGVSTNHAQLTRVNRTRKPIGHVTPGLLLFPAVSQVHKASFVRRGSKVRVGVATFGP